MRSRVAIGVIVVSVTFAVALVKMTECGPLAGPVVLPCVDPTASDDDEVMTYFDSSRQLCCDGAVYQVDELRGQSCCGKQVVDRVTHICCGGEALPVDGDIHLQCCGDSLVFDTATHMCCGNNLYQRTHDFNTCCGNYPMDGLQDTCCQVTGPSGTRTMPANGKGQCCSLELTYDPEEQICCQRETDDGIISEVVGRGNVAQACCGGRAYNTSQQVCCDDHLRNVVNGDTQCCGNALYNPDNMCCCANKLFPIGHGQCCGDQPYHPGSASCCHSILQPGIPEVSGVQGCCGPVSFLATESLCCDGLLHDRAPGSDCCGEGTYNNETELCCSGNVRTKTSVDDKCCGLSSYDPSKETCCPGAYPPVVGEQLSPVVRGSCCGEMAFLPMEATCCVGKTREVLYRDVPSSTSTCCGQHLLQTDTHLCDPRTEHPVRKSHPVDDSVCTNFSWSRLKSYNSRTEVCIRGKVRSRNRINQSRRCGHRSLDPKTELCCQGKIHPARDEQGNPRHCCHYSIHSFVPQYQTCCSGRVDNISSQTSKCCRNRAYNTATHACDRSSMIRPISSVARYPLTCSGQPYHPDEKGCCGRHLFGPGQTCCRGLVYETGVTTLGGGACCRGVTGYDPARDLCCGQTVHRGTLLGAVCCGNEAYSSQNTSQICCQGTLHSFHGGVRRNCSGGTAYDAATEIVCGGVVHPRGNGACCGSVLYDTALGICCNGILYPKTATATACCGTVPYDPSDPQARCCDGSLHRATRAFSTCCGNMLFDQRYEHCCLDADRRVPSVLRVAGGRTCNSLRSAGDGAVHVLCEGLVQAAGPLGSCCDEGVGGGSSSVYVCCSGHVLPRLYGDRTKCCGRDIINAAVEIC